MNTIRLEVDFGLQPSSQSEEEKQAEVMLKMDRLAAKDRLRAMYKDGTKPYTGPLPNARNAEYERKARAEKKRREEEQRKAQQEKKWEEDRHAARQSSETNWGHQLLRIKEKNFEDLKEEQRSALMASKADNTVAVEASGSPTPPIPSRLAKRRNQRLAAEKAASPTKPAMLVVGDSGVIQRMAEIDRVVTGVFGNGEAE